MVNQVNYATVYNTYGYCDKYKDNNRLKESSKDISSIGSGGYVATGVMAIDTNKYNELNIYLSGCIYDGDSLSAIHLIIDDNLHELRKIKDDNVFIMDNNNNTDYKVHLEVEEISESYYKIIITNYNEIKEYIKDKTIYFATSLYGLGKDLIITFNEEISD